MRFSEGSIMRNPLIEYLVRHEVIDAEKLAQFKRHWRDAADSIGAIAFRHGVLSGADVDDILDEQVREYRPFGQIARELGRLTEEQVNALLQMQQLRLAMDLLEALVVAQVATAEELVPHFGRFLQECPLEIPQDVRDRVALRDS